MNLTTNTLLMSTIVLGLANVRVSGQCQSCIVNQDWNPSGHYTLRFDESPWYHAEWIEAAGDWHGAISSCGASMSAPTAGGAWSISPVLSLFLPSMSMCAARALQAAPKGSQVTYAEFMKLDVETRMKLFSTLPAESKAALKRAHAEEWLRKHRSELTTSQVDVVNRTIRFIAPELYTQPSDPSLRKREEELERSLVCSIGRERAQEAFMLKQSQPQPETHTLASLASDWLEWFTECVIR